MKIYLASRFGRKLEMREKAAQVISLGHEVTAMWLNQEEDSIKVERHDAESAAKWSVIDLECVNRCELLIAFTELSDSPYGRGGRHVEMGYAIGIGKAVWVVGHRENVFCHLPTVKFFREWADALKELR